MCHNVQRAAKRNIRFCGGIAAYFAAHGVNGASAMRYTTVRVRERKGRGLIAEASYKDEGGKWRKRSKTLDATGKRAA